MSQTCQLSLFCLTVATSTFRGSSSSFPHTTRNQFDYERDANVVDHFEVQSNDYATVSAKRAGAFPGSSSFPNATSNQLDYERDANVVDHFEVQSNDYATVSAKTTGAFPGSSSGKIQELAGQPVHAQSKRGQPVPAQSKAGQPVPSQNKTFTMEGSSGQDNFFPNKPQFSTQQQQQQQFSSQQQQQFSAQQQQQQKFNTQQQHQFSTQQQQQQQQQQQFGTQQEFSTQQQFSTQQSADAKMYTGTIDTNDGKSQSYFEQNSYVQHPAFDNRSRYVNLFFILLILVLIIPS